MTWTAPRREMIDPHEEIQAIKEQLKAGITSWQNVVRMFGYISEELREEPNLDKAMLDELGLMADSDPRFDPNRQSDGENYG